MDDLFAYDHTSAVLRYLPFEDKVRLESVSTQWRRCVYQQQTKLCMAKEGEESDEQHSLNRLQTDIQVRNYASGYAKTYNDMKTPDLQALTNLLKKCPFLVEIRMPKVYIDGPILCAIGQHCEYLETLEFEVIGLDLKVLTDFGSKYGHRLKKIEIHSARNCHYFLVKFSRHLNNLRSVACEELRAFVDEDVNFLPKLEEVEFEWNEKDLKWLKMLADRYENQLKKLKIISAYLNEENPCPILNEIARFRKLEELSFFFTGYEEVFHQAPAMVQMAKNCKDMKKLDIVMHYNDPTFDAIKLTGKFHSLVNLTVKVEFFEEDHQQKSFAELKHCKNLRVLKVQLKIDDSFLDNAHVYLPKLKRLSIITDQQVTDKGLEHVAKMKNLRKFRLNSYINESIITDDGVCHLVNNCPTLVNISLRNGHRIASHTIEALIQKAKNSPYTVHRFKCSSLQNSEEEALNIEEFNLPDNLIVKKLDI